MILEPDRYYYDPDGKYAWTQQRCDAAWADCYRRLEEMLAGGDFRKVVQLLGLPGCGKSHYARTHDADDLVLFDGLFVDRNRRRRVLEIARAAGVPVEVVWFQVPWETCVARNAQRTPDRVVPADTMTRLRQVLAQDPPTLAEGFAALHTIPAPDAGSGSA
jgi:predicted kinase